MSNIDVAALYRMFKLLDESKRTETKHPATQVQPLGLPEQLPVPPQGPSPARFRHRPTLRTAPEFTLLVRSTEEVKNRLDDMSAAINDLHNT
jgi:hypothetical protein